MKEDKIPEEFLEQFEIVEYDFITDDFEEMILRDVYRFDKETLEKISRDITEIFINWAKKKVDAKENISLSIKGTTRSNVGDTLVLMANSKFQRLDSITKGQMVMSINRETFKFEKKVVEEVYYNGFQPCCKIILEGGNEITSSYLHKFLSMKKSDLKNCEWIGVQNLEAGDYLAIPRTLFEKICEINSLDIKFRGDIKFKKIKSIEKVGIKKVYDIQVKDNHNYIANLIVSSNSGKSLVGLNICDFVLSLYDDKAFDSNKIVCGNQKEYRQKLKDSEFGDIFQIDENAFANVGMGSSTEMLQLKDIQNIIAKKNIHTIYITPRRFLDSNSMLGLSSFGKDSKNWLSRFLVYDLRKPHFPLLGYVVINVGKLFRKYGCFIYKEIGGCTNPLRKTIADIPKDNVKYSFCLPKKYNESLLLSDGKSCPFYNICHNPLCKYEHKKDSWIKKEMEGGMDERIFERYETGIKLLQKLSFYDSAQNQITLRARDAKQLKIKVNLYLWEVSSTKYTQGETEEFLVLLRSLCDLDFFKEVCRQLKIDYNDELSKIPKE